ncbi:MAG: DUF2326 domain-containing protein [Lewinellaceae bacterium]|nr:DUF2326 domain-containing protein [Lewinellaceae bacterium]
MFLRSLYILKGAEIIRRFDFRLGINLVVDVSIGEVTGNDVGKTTTLKLIDFCLGASRNSIYVSPDDPKNEYQLVKEFLVNNEILIQLYLSESFEGHNHDQILIERNFLLRNNAIRRVNGVDYGNDILFEEALKNILLPTYTGSRPTFRQIISHNIRYDDESLNSTLKTIHKYAKLVDYEALHLFMLGCDTTVGDERQEVLASLQQEENFKKRLEKHRTKNSYEVALNIIIGEIKALDEKKSRLNINPNFENDLISLNQIKYQIQQTSGQISNLEIRKKIIEEARLELEQDLSNIDSKQLKDIYSQAVSNLSGIQKTFESLVDYHNKMINNKIAFIIKELPKIESDLVLLNAELKRLLSEEEELANLIAKSDSFAELEEIIKELNNKYQKKGEYENTIAQLTTVDGSIGQLQNRLKFIDEQLFSDEFEEKVKTQVYKFNEYFSSISDALYGEKYALTYEIEVNREGKKYYKFSTFDINNPNMSSGKKQGEISCFEIAYILFARDENIPHLSFILNDKKELMHGNQLVDIAGIVKKENIQFVCSILEDKLPSELRNEAYYILKLSQSDKLFRIERYW